MGDTERTGQLRELVDGSVYRFSDWPVAEVPPVAAGVYSIWQDDTLVYVGMSGRGRSKGQLDAALSAGTKRVG